MGNPLFQLVLERILPLDVRSVRAARLALVDAPVSWEDEREREDAELVVSELVANAVTHTHNDAGAVTLRLLAEADVLRVEVDDPEPQWPTPRAPSLDAERGRGLHLVQALSRRHGVAPRSPGKCVWAELGVHGMIVVR